MTAELLIAALSLAVWIYLLGFRGLFWLFRERDDGPLPALRADLPRKQGRKIPGVVAVVPARNEADCIERALKSLDAQDYPGEFRIIAVDDQSTDDTASRIRHLESKRISLVSADARPRGWTGKLWALNRGIAEAETSAPDFLWLTDADIEHAKDNLSRLVARAEAGDFALVSLMAKLSCESLAERFLIPGFVFFFAMLYPFSRVNDRSGRTAAGAGGCMLVRRDALAAAGGIAAIQGEIIDDCALARRLKCEGPIWLGLSRRAASIRPYARFGDIRAMVARSAFAQLHYSWAMLMLTLLGMGLVYGAPPLIAIFGTGAARLLAVLAWVCMAVAFMPILKFYGRSPFWGLALPAIAGCYAAFTFDSALQHLRGRGAMWKGRAQASERRGSAPFGSRFALTTSPKPPSRLRRLSPQGPPPGFAGTPPASRREKAGGESGGKKGEAELNSAGLSSGKTHRDENFPVASVLIAPRHRGIILAFYRFVREADDISDHPQASAETKLHLLEEMRRSLAGESDDIASGVKLRELLRGRGVSPAHAFDLLEAFRRDVTKLRYRDWDDLVDYCSVSAMPVGRFVLDVHGESRAIWPLNDALCAALQIINHLQDCGADYAALNRVYIPQDAFAAAGLTPESLAQRPASEELRRVFRDVAARNRILLDRAAPFASMIRDRRLSLEVGVIHRLAVDLNQRLVTRDPLSERVHHGRAEVAMLGLSAVARQLLSLRLRQKRAIAAEGS